MKLSDLIEKYPRIRLATKNDNQEILELFSQVPMQTPGMDLNYSRGPDFFSLLREQSSRSFVFLITNDQNKIQGMGSIGLQKRYLDGQLVQSAYSGDLRILPNIERSIRKQWRWFYSDVCENVCSLEEFQDCRLMITAILDGNAAAIRALTRPKSRTGLKYQPLSKYTAANIYGRLPRKPSLKSRFSFLQAKEHEREAIHQFLIEQNKNKELGYYFSGDKDDEFQRRILFWQKFDVKSFLVAKNSAGEILACVYPRSFSNSRKLIVEKLSPSKRMLGWLLPTIGGKSLHLNQEINILYLTHLEIRGSLPSSERLELFRAMVDKIWKLKFRRNFHLVSLIKFDAVFLDQALSKSGFLYEKVDGTLYQVLHNKNIEQQMLPPLKSAPAFEVGLA